MNERDQEILRNWRIMMAAGAAYTPIMYFFSDLEYLGPEIVIYCGWWRIGLTALCSTGLLAAFAAPRSLLLHWRAALRVVSFSYYAFFVWFDHYSLDPDSSSYYVGIMLVGAGCMAFRIHREVGFNLLIATLAYVAANFARESTIEAALDLSVFTLIFWVISTNYHRVTQALTEAVDTQRMMSETIHHDWKPSFRAMAGFVEKLRPDLSTKNRETADLIEYTAHFLYAQSSQLVEESRPPGPAIDTTPASLSKQMNFALRTIRKVHRSKIILGQRPGNVKVQIDEHDLFRLFINLLSNAVLYSPDRRVTVNWTADNQTAIGRFRNRIEADSLLYRIHLNRIFERRFTLESGGRGLGLNSAKSIAERSGGDLRADLIDGELELTISLPINHAQKPG